MRMSGFWGVRKGRGRRGERKGREGKGDKFGGNQGSGD